MQLGSLEVQIFVSLVVVLGTAFIALVCDFLKGNNEQLRERNVELRTRQDEREKLGLSQPMAWLQGLAALVQRGPAHAAPAPVTPEAAAPVATPVTPPAAVAQAPVPEAKPVTWTPPEPVAPVQEPASELPMRRRLYDEVRSTASGNTWASKEELEQLAGRAARIRAKHEAGQQPSTDFTEEPKFASAEPAAAAPEAPPPPPPVSPIAAEPAIPANYKIHILPLSPAVEPEAPVVDIQPEVETAPEVEKTPETAFAAEPVAEQLPEPLAGLNYEFAQTDDSEPPPAAEPDPVAVEQLIEETQAGASDAAPLPSSTAVLLPAGMHEPAVLSGLLEANQPFSGVAVSIGINDFEALRERLATAANSAEAMTPVQKLIDSMLRPEDFACRFNEDEFVLLFPGEAGSSAQRRLFQVSEKLWDFQLRSLGQLAIIFSWGGLEVPNDSLSSAVSAARERMYHTRRNRRQSPLDRKRVVNG